MPLPGTFKKSFERAKEELLNDKTINADNRKLFAEFYEYQEVKLKRINNRTKLDDASYKTLYKYIQLIRNTNKWFKNKDWKELTKEDITKVYNDLEDGKLKTLAGNIIKTKDDYYIKVFKSKLFKLAGKDELAKEVIEYMIPNKKEVRFITEDDFKKIEFNANNPKHKLLLWLAWDIGENINALLQLQKKDFYKQKNEHTKEDEYRINLKQEILKRSRKARSEITNYKETTILLDQILPDYDINEKVFNFDYRNAKKIIDRAVEKSKVKCIPNGEDVTWKDLRSGMACHLLKTGYTTNEVNARLGHAPSSSEIDKYINFLALDRHTPKKKVHQFEMEKLNDELVEMKKREKLNAQRNEQLQEQMLDMQKKLALIERFEKVMKKQK
jgi:hypothetical protein